MKQRQILHCLCGCGSSTGRNYAPGHDSQHVSRLVSETTGSWGREPYYTRKVWERAMRELPTLALRSKYRRAMMNRARKALPETVNAMMSESWQSLIHLQWDVAAVDSAFKGSGPLALAEAAAAMGWSRHAINLKHS